jgi:two-component system, NarL family, sensor kinase
MEPKNAAIAILLVVTTLLLALLVACAIAAIYLHNRWRLAQQQYLQGVQDHHAQQLMGSRLAAQEQTLQQLMREIHDNIGSGLTHAKLALATISFTDMQQVRQNVQLSTEAIGQALDDIRSLSLSLNNEFVATNGLLYAIQHEADRVARYSGLHIYYQESGNTDFLPTETELMLFRMVQEILTNTVKHAGAKYVQVRVSFGIDELTIGLADDGCGFAYRPPSDPMPTRGNGLANLLQRAQVLGGHCQISSTPGSGTTIVITIPLPIKDTA